MCAAHSPATNKEAGIPQSKKRSGPCSGGVQIKLMANPTRPDTTRHVRKVLPMACRESDHHAMPTPMIKSSSSQSEKNLAGGAEGATTAPATTAITKNMTTRDSPFRSGKNMEHANTK